MIKFNLNDFKKQMSALEHEFDDLATGALQEFKKNTPVDTGNARRKTRLDNDKIVADYPYAQRLEDNYSSQTKGKGMIQPTVDWIQQEVDRRLKGI